MFSNLRTIVFSLFVYSSFLRFETPQVSYAYKTTAKPVVKDILFIGF